MPIFEFECLECGSEFEKLVLRRNETQKVSCPSCGSTKVEEKFSSFASSVRGGGTSGQAACAPSGG
jgi:putative FmdB family regulatory protein